MSYTVRFTGTRAEREAAALKECKEYLETNTRFKRVTLALREGWESGKRPATRMRTAYFLCSMIGIQGRWPVRAMVKAALTH